MNHTKKEAAVLAAAIGAILGVSEDVAFAQDEEVIEEITVTVTRIQRTTGFTSPVPVTSISRDELTAFAPGNTIGEALDKLPQFFNTDTAMK